MKFRDVTSLGWLPGLKSQQTSTRVIQVVLRISHDRRISNTSDLRGRSREKTLDHRRTISGVLDRCWLLWLLSPETIGSIVNRGPTPFDIGAERGSI